MTKTTTIPPEAQAAIDEARKSGDDVWCLVHDPCPGDPRIRWIVFRRSATDLMHGVIDYRTNELHPSGWANIHVSYAKDAWNRWIEIGAVRVV